MLETIFRTVLTQSIAGGFLSIIIMSIKPLTTKKFNALWQYYVWAIVIVLLLVPFIPNIPAFDIYTAPTAHIDIFSNIDVHRGDSHQNPLINSSISLTYISSSMQIKQLIPWLWFAGALLFAIYNAYKYIKLHLLLKQNSILLTDLTIKKILDTCRSEMGIKKNISVYNSAIIDTPILSGLFKPVVTLPDINFSPEEYRLIFTHELTHYKRKDLWYKMLALAANTIHWFNPTTYMAVKSINDLCEYACDESVISNMDDAEKKCYSETILNLITIQTDRKMAMSIALCGIKKIERRINMILNFKKPKVGVVIAAAAVVVVLAAGGVFASGFIGKTVSIIANVDSNSSAKSNSEENSLKEMQDFSSEWDKTMAKTFNIDLSGYRKIETMVGFMKPEYRELKIGDVREQISLNYGDRVPSVYLNSTNNRGIAATQDLNGLYTLYEFEVNVSNDSRFKWKITGSKTVQGERKFVNEEEKAFFTKNPSPNPDDNKQPPPQTPTSEYEITVQQK